MVRSVRGQIFLLWLWIVLKSTLFFPVKCQKRVSWAHHFHWKNILTRRVMLNLDVGIWDWQHEAEFWELVILKSRSLAARFLCMVKVPMATHIKCAVFWAGVANDRCSNGNTYNPIAKTCVWIHAAQKTWYQCRFHCANNGANDMIVLPTLDIIRWFEYHMNSNTGLSKCYDMSLTCTTNNN